MCRKNDKVCEGSKEVEPFRIILDNKNEWARCYSRQFSKTKVYMQTEPPHALS